MMQNEIIQSYLFSHLIQSILFPSCFVVWLCGFVTAFIRNLYVVLALRFAVGFFLPGAMVLCIVLISEIVGKIVLRYTLWASSRILAGLFQ